MKDFTGDAIDAEWVGLDMKIDHQALESTGYHEAYECDFDKPLPLPDGSVDVAVFLHVIEHLSRSSFAMRELSRILRPGGLLLAGSPVAPGPIAWIRERQLRSRLRKGKVLPGGHINSMGCSRWKNLVKESGLDLRMLTGTFLARWSGSPLENRAWWLRLNQFWGALFPPLGGEAYLSARKPAEADFPTAHPAAGRVFMSWNWKKGLALSCIMIIILSWSFFFNDRETPESRSSPRAAYQQPR
jgi:SAM-dependent methyltransferase